MMYPELYQSGMNDFSRNGILLTDAFNVSVKKRINAAPVLTFNMQRDSRKWKHIKREAVIKADGQLYVIKIINDGATYGKIEARHIWWERCEKQHIPSAYFIGDSASVIIGEVFSGISYGENAVTQMSEGEILSLGLTPVTARTDIDMDKTNPLAVLSKIIDNVSGEVYVDNFKFALVKQLGHDNGMCLRLDKNLKGVDRTDEATKLVTRLYPYGSEGLEIDSVNGGLDYIDSTFINDYSYIHEGFIEFRDIETKEELLKRA